MDDMLLSTEPKQRASGDLIDLIVCRKDTLRHAVFADFFYMHLLVYITICPNYISCENRNNMLKYFSDINKILCS